jgi:hypothetical protein
MSAKPPPKEPMAERAMPKTTTSRLLILFVSWLLEICFAVQGSWPEILNLHPYHFLTGPESTIAAPGTG